MNRDKVDNPVAVPMMTVSCPHCSCVDQQSGARCCNCGADLRPLRCLRAMVDLSFNEALAAAQAKKWQRAAGAISAALLISPGDTGALVLATKIFARIGERQRVEELLDDLASHLEGNELSRLQQAALRLVQRSEKQRERRKRVQT